MNATVVKPDFSTLTYYVSPATTGYVAPLVALTTVPVSYFFLTVIVGDATALPFAALIALIVIEETGLVET